MNKKEIYQQLSVLIQAGKTAEAFKFLNQQKLDAKTTKNCSILQAEYSLLKEDELKGTISFEERQMRRNRINDKILNLLADEPASGIKSYFASPLLKVLIPLVLLTIATLIWWKLNFQPYSCPSYPDNINNKVLVLPFQKVGGQEETTPELTLRNRINKITQKNNLSTKAEIGTFVNNISTDDATAITKQCNADLIIWGTYSSRADSTRLTIEYHFSESTEWSNDGKLIAIKDVTELYNGTMLKDMDDAIMSLCGFLAIKEGNTELAKKWFKKVKNEELVDSKLLKLLN